MWSRPESDETLIFRLLPSQNTDRADRARAWSEWQAQGGERALLRFIQVYNNTGEADEDVLQDAMLTAYLEVERGRYEVRSGVPFTAYVKGIARNKIREARRRERNLADLDEAAQVSGEADPRHLEAVVEQREQQQLFQLGLGGLPDQRRQVLERILKGDSTDEIAGELAISEALVRQHKCRAVRSLRVLVEHLSQQRNAGYGYGTGQAPYLPA